MTTTNGEWMFKIDSEACSGHGRCYALAPQWFTADESGYGTPTGLVAPGTSLADMEFIVDSCPEQAISIVPVHAAAAETGRESK
jgi:ferredoxin